MKESDTQRQIQAALSHGDTRLFRAQVGTYWAGVVVNRTPDTITLRHYQAVRVGVPGMADLIGIGPGGRYVSLEVKRTPTSRISPEQIAWLNLIHSLGGLAGIVSDVDGARAILTGRTTL